MSDLTINAWVNQESEYFENFNKPLASRFEEGWCAALGEAMRKQLAENGSAKVMLPWGTYYAEVVTKGEAGNISVSWEPAKGFMKILNNDLTNEEQLDTIMQEEFDKNFAELYRDYVAYGFFYPNAPENKDKISDKKKSVYLMDDETVYFLNSYALMLANIAKDKQREGKLINVEINNSYPHGEFTFEYKDDEITVKWTADKVFKQTLKNDVVAAFGEQ